MTALSLAQTAATEYWGPPPCAVSIAYAPASAAPAVDTDGVPVPVLWAWTDSASCVVTVNSDRWPLVDQNIDFPDFCGLIVHEYGHLFGHPDLATDSPASITYPFVGPLNEGVAPCVGRYRLALRSS